MFKPETLYTTIVYMSGLTQIETDALVTLTQTERGRINRLLRKDRSLRSAFYHFAMYTAFTLISSLSYPSSDYILAYYSLGNKNRFPPKRTKAREFEIHTL